MTKLRRMLGNIEDPSIIALMQIIETQSASTLAQWSLNYVKKNIINLYLEKRIKDVMINTKETIEGKYPVKELKKDIKEAKNILKEVEDDPIATATIHSILTACACYYTPTNTLGFIFFVIAAIIYPKEGLEKTKKNMINLLMQNSKTF